MRPLYIFDLDGTLADPEHRKAWLKMDQLGDRKWREFYRACRLDAPIFPVIETLDRLLRTNAEIWIVSGRSEEVAGMTRDWLRLYVPNFFADLDIYPARLYLRREGDHRTDEALKQEFLDQMLPADRLRLVAAFEDRDRVVAMWRRNGVPCFQVAPGEF